MRRDHRPCTFWLRDRHPSQCYRTFVHARFHLLGIIVPALDGTIVPALDGTIVLVPACDSGSLSQHASATGPPSQLIQGNPCVRGPATRAPGITRVSFLFLRLQLFSTFHFSPRAATRGPSILAHRLCLRERFTESMDFALSLHVCSTVGSNETLLFSIIFSSHIYSINYSFGFPQCISTRRHEKKKTKKQLHF